MQSLLGMYMHTHWAYAQPYAVRTWTPEHWKGYLTGLSRLGYNLIQIWPMLDTMPVPPTPSDVAHLEKLAAVTAFAKGLGMTVYLGICANTSCNDRARETAFAERNYFECEALLDLADETAMAREMERRRVLFEPLVGCDGIWILDSDPGGWDGSPVRDFARVFDRHRRMFGAIDGDHIRLVYWMWSGWTGTRHRFDDDWRNNPQDCWREALAGLVESDPAPWALHACWLGHFKVVEELGLADRAHFYPYNLVENEPSYPFTNWAPERLAAEFAQFAPYRYPMGVLGNSQNHCVQLPHAYVFAHLARGGSVETLAPAGFGERLLPGHGTALAEAWQAASLATVDPGRPRAAAAALARILEQDPIPTGDLEGLLFGSARRYVDDLKLQMDLWAEVLELRRIDPAAPGLRARLAALVAALRAWTDRHRFADRYGDYIFYEQVHPLYARGFAALGTPEGQAVVDHLEAFRKQRHGTTSRLIARMSDAVGGKADVG